MKLQTKQIYKIQIKTKHCSNCNKTKPISEFNKNKYKSDGLQGWCRKCQRSHYKNYYNEVNKIDKNKLNYPVNPQLTQASTGFKSSGVTKSQFNNTETIHDLLKEIIVELKDIKKIIKMR